MDDGLHGFASSEIFTLIVGSNKEKLSVQKGILTKIPYFVQALSSGLFIESQSRTFEFPDLNVKAVADVIYYSHTGCVAKILPSNQSEFFEEDRKSEAYVRAYIIADMWGARDTANALIDEIIRYHELQLVHPNCITLLNSAGLGDSPLCKLLLDGLVHEMSRQSYRQWVAYGHDKEDLEWQYAPSNTFENACSRLPRKAMLRILCATQTTHMKKSAGPIKVALRDLDKYHKQTQLKGGQPKTDVETK